jgi:uncharacterized protein YndB with AHSA1/START domain
MNLLAHPESYGSLIEPATFRIERLLPGTIERAWSYLVDSDLRRRWLAAGEMDLKVGAPFELDWRNDELTDPPGARPDGFGEEHRMACRIVEVDPPHHLIFTWGERADVMIDLAPAGDGVLLTLVHRRLPDRNAILNVSPGWHAHLDVLVAVALGRTPKPFWDECTRLRSEYVKRLGL